MESWIVGAAALAWVALEVAGLALVARAGRRTPWVAWVPIVPLVAGVALAAWLAGKGVRVLAVAVAVAAVAVALLVDRGLRRPAAMGPS